MAEQAINKELSMGLNELKKANSDISKAFLFQNKKILSKDERTTEEDTKKTIKAFESLSNQANIMEGIEAISIQGTNGRLDITHINDYYLTTVASKEADEKNINNLTQILAPTIFKQAQEKDQLTKQPIINITQPNSEKKIPATIEPSADLQETEPLETIPPMPQFAEFVVDNVSRLGIITSSSETVRLDAITIGRWIEHFGENQVNEVIIKVDRTGKTVQCRFEEVQGSNYERQGVILIPDNFQKQLEVKKGEKVLVKPLLLTESHEDTPEDIPKRKFETAKQAGFTPNSPSCQLLVDNLSGLSLITAPDVVRFDKGLLERWKEFYGDRKIEEVKIKDTVFGKTVRCKFKILNDSKFEGKGLIQIPRSIRQELAIDEGSLVTIQPIVE